MGLPIYDGWASSTVREGRANSGGYLWRQGHGVRSDPAGGVAPRWRMGRLRLPQIVPTGPARRTSRAFAVAGYRPADDAGRGARRRHGDGPTRGDAVTDLPLIKAAKLWARSRRGPGPLAAMLARMIS